MKSNAKLYSIALIPIALILFLILISSMASAAYVNDVPKIIEKRITNGEITVGPDIYEDRIVWTGYPTTFPYEGDIYMYNLTTKNETRITNNGTVGLYQFLRSTVI